MIWLFAFKYWVISIEMPKALEALSDSKDSMLINEKDNSEKIYNIVMWLGVITNVFFVTIYGYFYGHVCMKNSSEPS